MKQYKFIRMKNTLLNGYVSSEKYGKLGHREIIRNMAEQGYRFVGQLPVESDGYGRVTIYDLVFEKEE